MAMLAPQKTVLKENIIEPILGSIFENCTKQQARSLINEAKQGQLGRRRFVELYGQYHSEMLDALNGISRIYEDPKKILINTFGSNTPSDEDIKIASDEIINSLLETYYPNVPNANNSYQTYTNRSDDQREFMNLIREKIAEIKGPLDHDLAKEIRRLKAQAGIPNSGSTTYGNEFNLSNLDLSNMDFSGLYFKGGSFTNSNLSNTNFSKTDLSRCIFDGCNLENTNFNEARLIGEEVSFKNANVRKTNFIGIKIERGNTWHTLESPREIKNEIRNRGALNVDEAIFTFSDLTQNNNNSNYSNTDNLRMFRQSQQNSPPPNQNHQQETVQLNLFTEQMTRNYNTLYRQLSQVQNQISQCQRQFQEQQRKEEENNTSKSRKKHEHCNLM